MINQDPLFLTEEGKKIETAKYFSRFTIFPIKSGIMAEPVSPSHSTTHIFYLNKVG